MTGHLLGQIGISPGDLPGAGELGLPPWLWAVAATWVAAEVVLGVARRTPLWLTRRVLGALSRLSPFRAPAVPATARPQAACDAPTRLDDRPDARRRPPPEPHGADRYRILRPLSEQGNMGKVFLAEDLWLRRQVVVKIPRLQGIRDERERRELIQRFIREVRATTSIDHPNVCRVRDVGNVSAFESLSEAAEAEQNGDAPYLSMDFISPKRLTAHAPAPPLDAAARKALLPPDEAARVVRKIALAMQAVHDGGFIHRDLKPDNVLLRDGLDPVVIDFGLVKACDALKTHPGQQMGTPWYMSPEQVRPGDVTPATDVYSLGVVLYHLLTGLPPFPDPDVFVVMAAIRRGDPKPPGQLRPDLAPRLEAICLKAMALKSADRHASMAELAAELGDYLALPSPSGPPAPVPPSVPPDEAPAPGGLTVRWYFEQPGVWARLWRWLTGWRVLRLEFGQGTPASAGDLLLLGGPNSPPREIKGSMGAAAQLELDLDAYHVLATFSPKNQNRIWVKQPRRDPYQTEIYCRLVAAKGGSGKRVLLDESVTVIPPPDPETIL